METAVKEAPAEQTIDELLAEVRRREFGSVLDEKGALVPVKLTVSQAGYLWEKLYRPVRFGARFRPETAKRDRLTVPLALFFMLEERLDELPRTTPCAARGRGRVRFFERTLTLTLMRHEARYMLQILKNKKRDQWRREKLERERFAPLSVAEFAEENGGRASFYSAVHAEHPNAMLRRAVTRKALDELPKKLGMPAKEVKALLSALAAARGNISEAARQLGQPQRKTARRVERIARHFERRDLAD